VLRDLEKPGEKYRMVDFEHYLHSRPDVGTYSLFNSENSDGINIDNHFVVQYTDSDFNGIFKSVGGTLVIRYSNNDELIGSFGYTAYALLPGRGVPKRVEVEISGEFFAIKGDTGIDLN